MKTITLSDEQAEMLRGILSAHNDSPHDGLRSHELELLDESISAQLSVDTKRAQCPDAARPRCRLCGKRAAIDARGITLAHHDGLSGVCAGSRINAPLGPRLT